MPLCVDNDINKFQLLLLLLAFDETYLCYTVNEVRPINIDILYWYEVTKKLSVFFYLFIY